MQYEVDVTIPKPLDDRTRRLLDSACRSANRVIRFTGSEQCLTLTVNVSGMGRDDAIRAAVREVASLFPACDNERYGEPRPADSSRSA
jgi:hypothetical protein